MTAKELSTALSKHGLQYKLLEKPVPEIKQLLEETVYGTKGLLYSHLDVIERSNALKEGHFHGLWRGESLIALAVYCGRKLSHEGEEINGRYIRFFSVKKTEQSKGLGRLLTSCIEQHYYAQGNNPTLFYAYIDNKNLRSMKVSGHFNGQLCGHFDTYLFSRFSPRRSARVRKAMEADKPAILEILKKQYDGYAEFHTDYIFYNDNYYVLEQDGEVVAGIQSNPVRWKIVNIPGFQGFLMKHILPALPYINRLFNPKVFRFSALEGIFYRDNPLVLEELISHCLAEQKNHTAMFWADVNDSYLQQLAKRCNLGFVSKVQHNPRVNFIIIPYLMSDAQVQVLHEQPKYISAFDVT